MYSLSFCTNRIGSHKNRNIFWKTSSFSDFFSVCALQRFRFTIYRLSLFAFLPAVSVVTFAAFRTAFALLLGLFAARKQHFAGEFEFAVLGIQPDEFHLDRVAFLESGLLHRLVTLVADLGDV